jgi:hypothetical protein
MALAGATLGRACQIPAFYAAINLRVMLASLIVGTYVLAGAYELWRCRS